MKVTCPPLDMTAKKGHPGWDSRKGLSGQDSQDRKERTGGQTLTIKNFLNLA
jgi:hypothetical protein